MYVYRYCNLLLNFEGVDGSTTISDSGYFNNTLTAYGNARIRTADYKIGSSSLYIDGTGDYVLSTSTLGPMWDAASYISQTYESWVKPIAWPASDGLLFGMWKSSNNNRVLAVFVSSTGELLVKYSSNGTAVTSASTGAFLTLSTWKHVRLHIWGAGVTTRRLALVVDNATVWSTASDVTVLGISTAHAVFCIGANNGGTEVMSECYYDSLIVSVPALITAAPTTVEITSGTHPIIFKRNVVTPRKFSCYLGRIYSTDTQTFNIDVATDGPKMFVPASQLGNTPAAPTGTVTGTVTILGVPTGRTVRSYRRDTGELVDEVVSNPTTGEYTISVFTGIEHNLVCLDDVAGTVQNDLIKRKTAA